MTLEVTGIALAVDSSDAVKAKANLEGMAAAGAAAASGLSKTEAASKTAAGAISASAAASAAGARAAVQQAAAAKSSADALRQTGQQSRLTGQQAAQMSAQLQDLFIQIQAGGNPLTALIQQGSQLSAVFGGVVPALRAVSGVFFSVAGGAAVLATGIAAAVGAMIVGREQSASLARALTLSGNAAGITEGQFNALARTLADATNTTIGSTRDTLLGLASSGRITGDVLTVAATAAQLLAKTTGQASDEIVKDFAKAADAPARFAAELNKSYNFLTAGQLDYIRTLENQGREQEALATTLSALIPRLQEAAGQTTVLASAFNKAKREVSDFIEALMRTETVEDNIKRIRGQLEELNRAGQKRYVFGPSAAELQAQLSAFERTADAQRKEAAFREANVKQRTAELAFDALKEKNLTKQAKLTRELAEANAIADKAGKSADERKPILDEIRKRNAGSESQGIAKAQLGLEIAAIKADEDRRLAIYRQSESVLDALRQAGRLRESEYYEAKRAFVALDEQTQAGALRAEIAKLQAFKGTAAENLEVQKQLTAASGRLEEVQSAAATKSIILNLQEKSSIDALKTAFSELEFAAVSALRATSRRVDFSVDALGLGQDEQQRAQEVFSIREQFTRQLEQLDSEFRAGRLRGQEDEYRKRRQLILDNQEFELNAVEDGFRRQDAARRDWRNGAARAFDDYAAKAKDTAAQVEEALSRGLSGMEDALVNFVRTGKLSFKDLADSIISDIARIIIKQQVVQPFAAALQGSGGVGSAFVSFFSRLFGGGRAGGGAVQAGKFYEINESNKGPGEILNVGGRQYLMAMQNGHVDPNTAPKSAPGGGAIVVQQTNHFAAGVSQAQLAPQLQEVKAQTVAAIVDLKRRGVIA